MRKSINKNVLIKVIVTVTIVIAFLVCIFSPNGLISVTNKSTSGTSYFAGGSGRGAVGGERITFNFNYDWIFSKGSGVNNKSSAAENEENITIIPNPSSTELLTPTSIDNPASTTYDSTNLGTVWKNVSLPHTYNDEDTFNNFTEPGYNGERSVYSGTAWYRKYFNLDSSYATNKTIIIEFEAARQEAQVWVNGHKLEGISSTGFTPFGYEIPNEYLNFGDGVANQNLITVLVDNTYPMHVRDNVGNITAGYIPWHDSHWHPNQGGLYRNAYLYVMDKLHLTVPLYSFTEGSGTYVYTSNETSSSAMVHVDAEIKNNYNVSKTFKYNMVIKNMSGTTVYTGNMIDANLSANTKQVFSMYTTLNDVMYWSTSYPYLYTVEVNIYDESNNKIDNNINTFGVRVFRFTRDSGFYLNEHSTTLEGWGQKPTWEMAVLGTAYPDWMVDYNMKLMKDANANYLRFGHSAGNATQISMANKYGILVTQPGVDGEGSSSANQMQWYASSYLLRTTAFRDTIIYFRNNPSIIMWEMGNHGDGLSLKTNPTYYDPYLGWLNYQSSDYSSVTNDTTYASVLFDVVQKYDYGNRESTSSILSNGAINSGSFANTTASSNRLITVRFNTHSELVPFIDVAETTLGAFGMDSASLGNKPSVEGEYLRMEARRGFWDHNTEGFQAKLNTSTFGNDYIISTEESFAILQVIDKFKILGLTNEIGGANWIFSDSTSHGRLTSEVSRVSGEVDGVGLPKQAYYASQIINSDTAGIHIIGHWNYPVGTTKNIYVVAKGVSKVELKINDVSIGYGNKTYNYLYTFSDIAWETGTITAIGYDDDNNIVVTDSITSHGEPDHLSITPSIGPGGLKANGSDVLILDVKLLDENNNLCETYDGEYNNQLVNYTYDLTTLDENNQTVSTGEFLGGYNSAVPANTRTDSLYLEAGISRIFVRTSKNAGPISVTATMGTMSDTYTTNSTQTTLTNGLTTEENLTSSYSLNPSNNLGLGVASQIEIEDPVTTLSTSKLLVNDLTYSGSTNDNNGVVDGFGIDSILYNDRDIIVTTIPYKFVNSELLFLPNDDLNIVANDLVSFDLTRASRVFVARDPSTIDSTWLTNEYTLSTDTITASNGVVYEIWYKDFSANSNVIIGTNTDIGELTDTQFNQFIFVKEISKVNNSIFFNENFNDFTLSHLTKGWNAFIPNNISVAKETVSGRDAIRFQDGGADISYIFKEFNPITNQFSLEYKAYVASGQPNDWIRILLSDGIQVEKTVNSVITEAYSNMDNVPIESYLAKSGTSLIVKYKNSSSNVITAVSGLPLNTWLTYLYEINPVSHSYVIKVYDENKEELLKESSSIPFSSSSINRLSVVTFGSAKTATFVTDASFDDVIITPELDIGATAIVVDGVNIDLNEMTTNYSLLSSNVPSDSTISFVETAAFESYTTSSTANSLTVSITNKVGNVFTFTIDYTVSSILNNWIKSTESVDYSIVPFVLNNEETIHVIDNSTTEAVYMYRTFSPINTALSIDYDFYMSDIDNIDDLLLRTFLTNGEMSDYNSFTNVGMRSYFTPQNGTYNEYVMAIEQSGGVDTTTLDDTLISKNAWHHVEYKVNVSTGFYSIKLDGTEVLTGIRFYNTLPQVDRVYIGTDVLGKADYNIKNFTIAETTVAPISGVSINQNSLPNFDPDSDTYNYYTDEVYDADTTIDVVSNSFYASHTITRDYELNTAVINVSDHLGNITTYTINFLNASERPISLAELIALRDQALTLQETDYTYNTWDILEAEIAEANAVIDNSSALPVEYSHAYYELNQAISNLLGLVVYTGYNTATIETIKNSTNLSYISGSDTIYNFSFDKVLDNDKKVYDDTNSPTFTSVPYMYLNAEYLKVKNTNYTNALIVIDPLQDLDLLVFKDRDAGPFTENGFTYTGEIATSSDGVVYKIYKKTITAATNGDNDNINIEFEKLLNNYVTSNNNIVAFIKSNISGNTHLVYEDMDDYNQTLFERSWESKVITASKSSNTIESDVNGNYLKMLSTATSSWGVVYKEMAKLDENISFKYSVNMPDFSSDSKKTNKFSRIWLKEGPGNVNAHSEASSYIEKSSTLAEVYVDNSTGTISSGTLYNNTASTAVKGAGIYIVSNGVKRLIRPQNTTSGALYINTWYNIEYRFNVKTKKYQIILDDVVYPSADTYFDMNIQALSGRSANTNEADNNVGVTYADYIYLASRYNGLSNYYVKDIMVDAIDSNMYSDILISGIESNPISIGNYKELTKAYLYQTSNNTDYTNATAIASAGSLYTSNGGTINPTYTTTSTSIDKKTNIVDTYSGVCTSYDTSISALMPTTSENCALATGTWTESTTGVYDRDYVVFFETQTDIDESNSPTVFAKNDLVDLIKLVQKENETYYTSSSFQAMEAELNDAIDRLANHSSTMEQVTADYNALLAAKNSLQLSSDSSAVYLTKIIPGKNYEIDFNNTPTNITRKSSLTASYILTARMSGNTYTYAGQTHERYLTSDVTLPVNTTLTLIDQLSNKYYYYVVSSEDVTNNTTRYPLSKFMNMGTIPSCSDSNYTNKSDCESNAGTWGTYFINTVNFDENTGILSGNYSIIIDYASTAGMATGTHTLALELDANGVPIVTSSGLSYSIYDKEVSLTVTGSTIEEVYSEGEEIGINIDCLMDSMVEDGVNITDTILNDNRVGVRVSILDENSELVITQKGIELTYLSNIYPLAQDNKMHLISQSGVQTGLFTFYLNTTIANFAPGTYNILIEVVLSPDGQSGEYILGTETIPVEIESKGNCSIYANSYGAHSTPVLYRDKDLSYSFKIDSICNHTGGDTSITVSLYKKSNNVIDNFDYELIDYKSHVNNSSTVAYTIPNVYLVTTHEGTGLVRNEYHDMYDITFKNTIPPGLYKLVFDIRSSNTVQTDFISITVK